jgi:hypothetical protein
MKKYHQDKEVMNGQMKVVLNQLLIGKLIQVSLQKSFKVATSKYMSMNMLMLAI